MLELKGITIKAGGFAVKDINLSIAPGTCHMIIGPTGCGKSTLLETIVGLRRPYAGEIWLDGRLINDLPIHKRGIAYLPQDIALFPHLTVYENILYGLRVCKDRDERHRRFAMELAEDLGITPLLHRPITHLSGGERQRVALIRALAAGSRYLLLDEPFSALHEAMKRDLWFLVDELKRRLGIAIVMVSHDMEEAFFLADYISVMVDGRLHQSGIKDDIYNMPSTSEVVDFFGIKNLFKAEIIEMRGDFASIYCPELSTELILPASRLTAFTKGASVKVGIRPEAIMILRPDKGGLGKENILHGEIMGIFKKGASYLVIFKPDGAERTIEIDIPNYAFLKLSIKKGQNASVALKSESLFIVTE